MEVKARRVVWTALSVSVRSCCGVAVLVWLWRAALVVVASLVFLWGALLSWAFRCCRCGFSVPVSLTLRSSGTRLIVAVLKVCCFFSFGGFASLP
jgi:hypothetical protein